MGDAKVWDDRANSAGIAVDGNPVVGSIAQWEGGLGHVAYVEEVTADSITISEDSYDPDMNGYTSRRVLPRAGATFRTAKFLHIADTAASPLGVFDRADGVVGAVGGWVSIAGWAFDPDLAVSPAKVHVYIDGPAGGGAQMVEVVADVERPDVASAHPGAGSAHGFATALGGFAPGPHTLWVYAINTGPGVNVLLGSLTATVPTTAAGTPFGYFESAEGRVGGAAVVQGWTVDPDSLTTSTEVHGYIDGPAGSGAEFRYLGVASKLRQDVAGQYPGAGPRHGFKQTISGLTPGHHTIYAYAVNVAGGGDNPLLGTITVEVPGPDPLGSFDRADGVVGAVGGWVSIAGWALDPDSATAPAKVHVYIDGPAGGGAQMVEVVADVERADVASAHPGAGAAHGFATALGGFTPGAHTLWVYGINTGPGVNVLLGSLTATVPPTAAGTPFGYFESAEGRVGGSAIVQGWTVDPDSLTTSTEVHGYIDGPAGSGAEFKYLGVASKSRQDVAEQYPGAGVRHGFKQKISGLTPGHHTVYVYAVNAAGGGSNPLLGTITIKVKR